MANSYLGGVLRIAVAGAVLLGAQPACCQEEEHVPLRATGSASLSLGQQKNNPDSIFTAEGEGVSLVSRKTSAVLKIERPGSWSGVLDAQVDDRPYAEDRTQSRVNQLYVAYDVNDALRLRVGKQRVLWGHGFAYIPTDFINPPLDPSGLDLAKVGVPSLSFDYVAETFALTGIVRKEERKAADSAGIKFSTSALRSGLDLDLVYYHAPSIGNAGGASFAIDAEQLLSPRFSGLVLSGAVAIHRKSRYPAFTEAQLDVGGATVSYPAPGTLGQRGAYRSYMAGANYQATSSLSFATEYYYIGDAYTASQYAGILDALTDSAGARRALASPWLDHLAFGRNQRRYLSFTVAQGPLTDGASRFTDNSSVDFGLLRNLGDRSNLWSISFRTNYWRRTELSLRAFVPAGKRASEFGSAPYTWYVELGLKAGF